MTKRSLMLVPLAFILAGCCAYGPQVKRATVVKKDNIVETKRTEKGLEIRLKGDVSFDYRSSELKDKAAEVVDDLGADFVKKDYKDITVIGHTDNRGTDGFNMRLSRDRAQAVKDRLVAAGVKGSRIATDGKGPSQPIATNDTDEGRTKNRRVEILVKE
jgi:outer membrane protein OmpA-like peptidoglycan-associated protein